LCEGITAKLFALVLADSSRAIRGLGLRNTALKTRIIAWNPTKFWAPKSAHWIGGWRHSKIRKTYPNHDVIDQKPQT